MTKAKSSEANDQLRPRSSIGNRDIFRGETNSSSEAEADDEKDGDGDGESEPGSWESVGIDDEGEILEESDKENQPSPADNNVAATLHEDFERVTLGSKRQRGQGMEELEDGEIAEEDELAARMDPGKKKKKKKSTSPVQSSLSSPLQAVEGKKEQHAKRVKMVETPARVDGESILQAQSKQPVAWTMTMG